MYQRLLELKAVGYANEEIAESLNKEYNTKFTRMAVAKKVYNEKTRKVNKVKKAIDGDHTTTKKKYNDNGEIKHVDLDVSLTFKNKVNKTPEEVMELKGYSPDEWQILDVTDNDWSMTNGEGERYWNYQCKIRIAPKKKNDIDYVEVLTQKIKPVSIPKVKTGKRNLVIPLADWHFGITKLSNVEVKLSEMIEVISKGYDQIVILQLGDLFHSSQIKKSVTMNETKLNDVDMKQAVEDCKRFFDLLITECVKHSNQVSVEHAEGNHSGNLEYMFLVYLEAKYPSVKVNYHNKYRTAFSLNRVGFFITHGQYAKRKDLPMLFATEHPSIWSDSVSREIFTGHFHTMQTQDYNGVVHRQLGTIKANDDYEIENGWTMNKKIIQLFEYDEERLKITYDI